MRALAVLFALCTAAVAQTVTLPFPASPFANTQIPLASGLGRYQEWFSAAQASNFGAEPLRVQSLSILAGASTSAAPSTTLDIEVAMAHAPGFGLSTTFDSNYVTPRTVVLPRTTLTMTSATAGNPVLNVPFTNLFTWDGQSPFLVEIRVFANGRNNQPFAFDLRSTDLGFGSVMRCYAGGNPAANTGTLVQNQGLFIRFNTRPGAKLAFGNGCRGVNNVMPTADTLQLPSPGAIWTHQLSNAAAQTIAVFALGPSRTQWVTPNGTAALTLDLGPLLNAFGCSLFVSPDIQFSLFTVGGPGTAGATLSLQVPPLSEFIGVSLYSQWFVLDSAALNGAMSGTAALWSIVTPVGG